MSQPFALNPSDAEFVANPIPLYARGRTECPVYRHPGLPLVSLFRYDDILATLKDHATWSSRFLAPPVGDGDPDEGSEGQSLLGLDPPEHDRLRSFVNRVFTPHRVARLEPRIREIARELMDEVLERGTVDFVEAYSYPLPVIVIAELIGIPSEARRQFKIWSDTVTDNLGEGVVGVPSDPASLQSRLGVAAEMADYFGRLIAERRRSPREDLLTQLARAERDGDRLSEREQLSMLTVMLIAGNETTRNLLGNAMIQLLGHPDELRRLRENPALMPTAVNEVLRFDSSVQATARRATRAVEIGGEKIEAGERALLWLGSANRDEAVFAEADRFDIARDPNPHVAFGFGIHYCLGSNLARLEARVALDELLRLARRIRRTDADPIEYTRSFILRGPKSLSLSLVPA
jgi:cytochrome P450